MRLRSGTGAARGVSIPGRWNAVLRHFNPVETKTNGTSALCRVRVQAQGMVGR
ncbi:hypothetical protein [Barnesiella sp. ET7]|uniref:hypothetical protein n=1 Tax=Barnesiella sp. ET7 TaxID=2972460 RepID=UPI0021AD2C78|nr:hypothetical protein [Barnesiella sp. ET7]